MRRNLLRVERVPGVEEALSDAVHEPFRIAGRNISSTAGAYDHGTTSVPSIVRRSVRHIDWGSSEVEVETGSLP
jgi:hypothetical protein